MSDIIANELETTGNDGQSGSLLDRVLSRLFGKMTPDVAERRNVWWQTIAGLFYLASISCGVGEAFYGKMGFSGKWIGILGTIGGVVSTASMFLLMGWLDRVKDRLKTIQICCFILGGLSLYSAAYVLFSRQMSFTTLIVLMLIPLPIGTTISNVANLLDYPVFVRTVRDGIRGRVWAIQAAAGAILGVVLGVFVVAKLMKIVPPMMNFSLMYLLGGVLMILKGVSITRLVELPDINVPGKSRSISPFAAIVDLWKMPQFRVLAYPHLLRGLLSATVGFLVPTFWKLYQMPDQNAGYIGSVVAGASFVGALVFGLTNDRFGSGIVTFLGEVICAIALVGIVLTGSSLPFFAFLALFWVGYIVEGNAIPLGAFEIVPTEVMGAFSSARLMILGAGAAAGAFAFGFVLDAKGAIIVFITVAILRVAMGAWFLKIFGLRRPSKPAPADA